MNSPQVVGGRPSSSAHVASPNHPATPTVPVSAAPHADSRALVACLIEWLDSQHDQTNALRVLKAVAHESLKRATSPDPHQREFEALDLAQAAQHGEQLDYEAAKRWVARSGAIDYIQARRVTLESHFRACGFTQALTLKKKSPAGKHRAVWYLEPYEIDELSNKSSTAEGAGPSEIHAHRVVYDDDPPGTIKPALLARPFISPRGSINVRSWRGVLWALLIAFLFLLPAALFTVLLGWAEVKREVQFADLASMILVAIFVAVLWRTMLRPIVWLVEDRMVLVNLGWVSLMSDAAQLELIKDSQGQRLLQLVRYKAICPVCAGSIELRYSQGVNRRRIVGCCSESPQEHVFEFDRVQRTGRRIAG